MVGVWILARMESVAAMTPCQHLNLTSKYYHYIDRATGYRDVGTLWHCCDCFESFDAEELADVRAKQAKEDEPHASDCPHWCGEPCICEVGKAYRGETE